MKKTSITLFLSSFFIISNAYPMDANLETLRKKEQDTRTGAIFGAKFTAACAGIHLASKYLANPERLVRISNFLKNSKNNIATSCKVTSEFAFGIGVLTGLVCAYQAWQYSKNKTIRETTEAFARTTIVE